MTSIFLACDRACWSKQRVEKKLFGGTEYRFYHMRKWLMEAGYDVYDPAIRPTNKKVDLVIHSNSFDYSVLGDKNILYAGSWHAGFAEPRIDKIFVVSDFMRRKIEKPDAVVIPPIYENVLKTYKDRSFVKKRIVTTANPNRHFAGSNEVSTLLYDRGVDFEWHLMGGNKVYSPVFPECFDFFSAPHLIYHGVLSRHNVLNVLTAAHIWAYPNNEESETFCIAMIEAAALGLPVVLMRKEPFISVLPGAFFADSFEEMADIIEEIIAKDITRVEYNISAYSEECVKPLLLEEIRKVLL